MGPGRVVVACLVAASVPAVIRGQETRTVTQPFIGVTLTRIETTVPRTLSMNLVEIDLAVPGIGFAVTPSNGGAVGDTIGLTTRQFLVQQGVQLAVNGGFSAGVSGSNFNVEGLAARQGVVYSEFQEFRTFALNISPDNVATILRASGTSGTAHTPTTTLYNVLPGEGRLLRNGSLIQYDGDTNQPRTGVGLGADETKLYFMTVDGRNSGHSLGVTRPELADFMRLNGVYNAFNLDGGGSTTLIVADPQPRVVNVPVGVNDVPGTERVVGSNFGVYALPMPVPAAVTINVAGGTTTQASAGHPFLVNALSLTKTGAGTLVLDASNTFTSTTEVRAGTLRLAKATGLQGSPTTVLAGAALDVVAGLTPRMPSLALAAGSMLSGSVTLGPTGIGRLTAAAAANLTATTLAIVAGGSATVTGTGTLGLRGLAIDPAGRLEIGSARLRVDAGGFDPAAVRESLAAGASGTAGITSAAVASAVAMGQRRTIGWRVETDGALSLGFAAPGDVNLDGQVNLSDITLINNGGRFGQGSASGAVWYQGDFDHSGGVTLTDINLLNNANVFLQGPYLPAAGGLGAAAASPVPGSSLSGPDGLVVSAVVPEPGAPLVGLAAALLALGRRRWRRPG